MARDNYIALLVLYLCFLSSITVSSETEYKEHLFTNELDVAILESSSKTDVNDDSDQLSFDDAINQAKMRIDYIDKTLFDIQNPSKNYTKKQIHQIVVENEYLKNEIAKLKKIISDKMQ